MHPIILQARKLKRKKLEKNFDWLPQKLTKIFFEIFSQQEILEEIKKNLMIRTIAEVPGIEDGELPMRNMWNRYPLCLWRDIRDNMLLDTWLS